MTIVKHELKQGKNSFLIWTAAIAMLLAVCVFLFPEMKGEMDGISDVFASMGSFTAAFGMDRLNFGTLVGFYAIECGNVLGLGGAFYAALCAVGILSKEEKERTAEFLLTHPVSRVKIITEKLIAVLIQITALNLIIYAKLRKSSIEMETITLDNIYKLMLNFGKLYDIISDEEKKSLITYLIKEIQIYPNGESEKPLKSIEFNFPIYRDGQEVRRLLWEKGNTVETVVLLCH